MVIDDTKVIADSPAPHPSGIPQALIDNIMSGISNTGGVKLNNHRKKLRQRFDIIKKLGQGTYGKVQLGINKESGQEVAIKTIKKCKIEAEADLIRIRREVQIMSSVQHPNIIHIYEVFENRDKMVLVMEFAAGGELYDYLSERKVLTEYEARRIFRQVSTAVYYCHKHKICHRDLKLENILLDENGNAKIADFGLSNIFDDEKHLATFCGSPLYASPEIVKGTPYQGPEVDCWSLGVLLYTLVYGSMPFEGSNFKRLVKHISQGDYYEPRKLSAASPLIRNMLTVCPKKRADIEEICSHWWVNEGYQESCLEVAEELANQTPVRLDVLLSLSPASVTSEQLVVTSGGCPHEKISRSHSVGSIRDVINSEAERRILDMVAEGGEAAIMPSSTRNAILMQRKSQINMPNYVLPKTFVQIEAPVRPEHTKKNIKAENIVNKNQKNSLPVESDLKQSESNSLQKNEGKSDTLTSNTPSTVIQKCFNKHDSADLRSDVAKISSNQTNYKTSTLQKTNMRKSSLPDECLIIKSSNICNKINKNSENNSESSNKKLICGAKVDELKNDTKISNIGYEKIYSDSEADLLIDKYQNIPSDIDAVLIKQFNEKQYDSNTSISVDKTESMKSICNYSLEEARRSMEHSIALLNLAKENSCEKLCDSPKTPAKKCFTEKLTEHEKKLKNAREIIINAIQPNGKLISASTLSDCPGTVKTSRAEITLKSATLPRRKTSYNTSDQSAKPAFLRVPLKFTPEVQEQQSSYGNTHIYKNPTSLNSRTSIAKPRAASLDPSENRLCTRTKLKPPIYNKSHLGFNKFRLSNSYDLNSDGRLNFNPLGLNNTPQPIKKSGREFIIPIAVEGGGIITPISVSDQLSKHNLKFTATHFINHDKHNVISTNVNAENEGRHSKHIIKDTEINECQEYKPTFSLNRLRSSRPCSKPKIDTDSQSSGEEDDDGFEILTAENLFSTLLQRVRALTNRLNIHDNIDAGFPKSSRLFNNIVQSHGPFWKNNAFRRPVDGIIGGQWAHSYNCNQSNEVDSLLATSSHTFPRGEYLQTQK